MTGSERVERAWAGLEEWFAQKLPNAQVRMCRFGSDIDSAMIQHRTDRPDFFALEYELLREC